MLYSLPNDLGQAKACPASVSAKSMPGQWNTRGNPSARLPRAGSYTPKCRARNGSPRLPQKLCGPSKVSWSVMRACIEDLVDFL